MRSFPAAAVVLLVVLVTGSASFLAFGPSGSGITAFWSIIGVPTLLLGAFAAAWARREVLLREWLTPRWGDFTRGLFGAAALFGLAWAFVRLVAPVGSPREIWLVSLYSQIGDPHVLHARGAAVAVAIVVSALAEEMIWRGLVTRLLAEKVGSRAAWVWAAVLYAAAYTPSAFVMTGGAGPNPVLVLAALGGGLLWGAMARAFGSLVPSTLSHALFDWAVVMMFPFWGPGHVG
jgi:uncharacterized protein